MKRTPASVADDTSMAASTCENAETSVLSQTLDDEADEWLFSSINE